MKQTKQNKKYGVHGRGYPRIGVYELLLLCVNTTISIKCVYYIGRDELVIFVRRNRKFSLWLTWE